MQMRAFKTKWRNAKLRQGKYLFFDQNAVISFSQIDAGYPFVRKK